MEDKVTNHPSFGAIQLDNVSGRHTLFMSSVESHHFVSLTICHAEHHRSLHYDRIHPGQEIIRVLMTPVQLGELLTNMNNGSGTPCTIERMFVNGKYKSIEDPPSLTKRETYEKEFKEDVANIGKSLETLLKMAKEMEAKPTVNKTERKALVEKIEAVQRDLVANLPFVLKQFNEHVEKVTAEAKNEVEQYRRDMIERLGMKALDAQIKSKELDIGGGQ